jgi:lipoprotein-releasing system permease protein
MFSAFERMMAGRYLRARRQEGFISVIAAFSLLGIALGVATLIIVMAVMNGFRHELLSRILGLSGHVIVHGGGPPLTEFDTLAGVVRGVEGVILVTPVVEGQVMATARGVAAGALVRGIRPEDLRRRTLVADNIVAGSLDDFTGRDSVVIGDRLALKMRLGVGDRITLISPEGTATAFGTVPRLRTYRVAATFNVGMFEYDSSFVFMPLAAAQVYFRLGNAVTALEIMLAEPERLTEARRAISAAIGPRGRFYDWQQANSHFFTALQVERNAMFLLLTLIIIISSLIMLVKDKGRDIAILRTMGATRGMVMRIFLLSGASVGIIGTIFGFILGLAFAKNIDVIRRWLEGLTGTELWSPEIRFLSQLPARVESTEVVMVVGMALALSFLATLYPSWRAARLDPVEALRYE